MPVPAEAIELQKQPFHYQWNAEVKDRPKQATGEGLYNYLPSKIGDDFFHSALKEYYTTNQQEYFDIERNAINKKFIKYEKSFLAQFEQLKHHFNEISQEEIKGLMNNSLSFLLELEPDMLGLELTSDKTIFYTFKKDNYIIYINHFADLEEEDAELTLTIFEGNTKLPSFAGNIESVKQKMNTIFLIEAFAV
ncbi:hypothetical protein LL912_19185 [Niabella sp. CC-SYL272]|uniref:hypothetical protein n=1 Tax=Niabella agricola TaxID=2891571 RepID=UPI001F43DE41|nr:hypothetical protein [Niabella agricola]MCF3110918.1 hypothetical protein [Niabella agricola]